MLHILWLRLWRKCGEICVYYWIFSITNWHLWDTRSLQCDWSHLCDGKYLFLDVV